MSEITRCDELASSRFDNDRVAPVVSHADLYVNTLETFTACVDAVREDPGNRRLMALLAYVESYVDPESGGHGADFAKAAADAGNSLGMYIYAQNAYALDDTESAAGYLVSALDIGPQAVLEELIIEVRKVRPLVLGRIFLTHEFQHWMRLAVKVENPLAILLLASCIEAGHHCEGSLQDSNELYTQAAIHGGSLESLLHFHFILKHRDAVFDTPEAAHEPISETIRRISMGEADWTTFELEYLDTLHFQINSGLYGDFSEFPDGSIRAFRELAIRAGNRLRS